MVPYWAGQALTQFITLVQAASVHAAAAAVTQVSVGLSVVTQVVHPAGVVPASGMQMKSEHGSSQVAPGVHAHLALIAASYLVLPDAFFCPQQLRHASLACELQSADPAPPAPVAAPPVLAPPTAPPVPEVAPPPLVVLPSGPLPPVPVLDELLQPHGVAAKTIALAAMPLNQSGCVCFKLALLAAFVLGHRSN